MEIFESSPQTDIISYHLFLIPKYAKTRYLTKCTYQVFRL